MASGAGREWGGCLLSPGLLLTAVLVAGGLSSLAAPPYDPGHLMNAVSLAVGGPVAVLLVVGGFALRGRRRRG